MKEADTADEWYRSPRWDERSRAAFEARLARARPYNRIQYRRIKALALLDSGDEARENVGVDLLMENLAQPDLWELERCLALVALAKRDHAQGRLADAEQRLREALAVARPDGSGMSGEEEIFLAEILLAKGANADIREAKALLDRRASDMPLFVQSRYRLAVAQARACLALGRHSEAAEWATAALTLTRTEQSGLAHHPKLGLVEPSEQQLGWLRDVAEGRR